MSETPSKAVERINALLDANSFVEIGGLVTARSTDFNLSALKAPSDGVVTGYGTIGGDLVYIYSQDPDVLGGTVGEMHAKKITNVYRLAGKMGAPVIGLIDCKGIRLQESTDAMASLGSIFRHQAQLSGVVPQIIGIFGNCGGGLSFVPALADFTFMEGKKASLFVSAPDALEGSTKDACDPSTAAAQAAAGNVDYVGSEEEVFTAMRALISMLPLNNEDDGYTDDCDDDLNRLVPAAESFEGDTLGILTEVADDNTVIEVGKAYGPSMVTAFLKLNGSTVGAVANRRAYTDENGEVVALDGKLCPCASKKAARFINFCDAFSIPVLTIAQPEGFRAKVHAEEELPKAAAKLVYAYAGATVPKVTLNIGRSFGSAAVVMGSKAVGADVVYAWPDAVIGTMDAKIAAKLMYEDADAETLAKEAETYADLQESAASAAARGYVDTIIAKEETRKYLIGAFEMLYSKREELPDRKHGTV